MRKPRTADRAEIRIESFGVRILVRVQPRSLAARVRSRLPRGPRLPETRRPDASYRMVLRPAAAGSPAGDLSRGGRIVVAGADGETLLDALESDLERFVAERARRVLFIHAGAVGWHGKAILLPGRSGSGKTTLVAALVRAGGVYLSDEYAVLDADGWVHPFPRRLGIRGVDGGSERVPAWALGGQICRRPLRLGQMLALVYRPGSPWRLHSLSPGQAAMALLEHTVAVRARPRAALAALARAVGDVSAVRGERGEADAFAAALIEGRLAETRPATTKVIGA
ncbi:MAG: hypothetical protein ACHQPI_06000 [Thermoanaerobaculia bacterium]